VTTEYLKPKIALLSDASAFTDLLAAKRNAELHDAEMVVAKLRTDIDAKQGTCCPRYIELA
jgi:hypothetical protein